jgi:hypothetical protein
MQVGDPKKAVVLGLVALAVVSVAVFRILPSGGPAPAARTSDRAGNASAANEPSPNTQTASAPATVAEQPGPTVTEMPSPNPFLHPAKAANAEKAQNPNGEGSDRTEQASARNQQVPNQRTKTSTKLPKPGGKTDSGNTRPADPIGGELSLRGEGEDSKGADTQDEAAGSESTGTTVKLLAIVSLKKPKALLSFNGGSPLSGFTGTQFNNISIHRIETHYVVIRSGKLQKTLRVGEEGTL